MKKFISIFILVLCVSFLILTYGQGIGFYDTEIKPLSSSFNQAHQTSENQIAPELQEITGDSTCKWYGYWDHLSAPDSGKVLANHVNFGKSFSPVSAGKIYEQGIASVVSMSHTMKPEQTVAQWRTILRRHAKVIKNFNPENIPFILLQDEPLAAGFTVNQLEKMVNEARSIIGSEFKYGFTFTRMHVQFRRSRLPQNADIYGINLYPFFERDYDSDNWVESEQDFRREFYGMMKAARKKAPEGASFFITGQAFSQPGKWRKPPYESPLWYAKAVHETPDIAGLMWFEWRDRGRWIGTQSMPELLKVQEQAFEIICPD